MNKEKVLHVRLDDELYKMITDAAETTGLSVSELIRQIMLIYCEGGFDSVL